MRRLVAAVACRNQGSRLYGKPLHNLDVENGVRIIDQIIACIRTLPMVDEIVLGVSEGIENEVYAKVAAEHSLKWIVGDAHDVLGRLIKCGEAAGATDIFRVTSESPYMYFEAVAELWDRHLNEQADATFMDDIVDGCGFQIISLDALKASHAKGTDKHRSEFCSLYIREHPQDFKIIRAAPPQTMVRKDLRLTVDNPEDLALCRIVYSRFRDAAPRIPLAEIIQFLDANPQLIGLTARFTEIGYSTMYR